MISRILVQFVYVLVLLGIVSVSARSLHAAERMLSYQITPIFEKENTRLKISLSFKGNKSGRTEIKLPDRFASVRELFKGVKNLAITTSDATLEDGENPTTKFIKHKSNQIVEISYELAQSRKNPMRAGRGGGYSPIFQKEYMHFLGAAGWVFPSLGREEKVKVKLKWKDFPEGWSLANSFGANRTKQEFSTRLSKFSSAIFVGGDYRVNKRIIKGKPIFIALRGKWSFNDEEFIDLVDKIVEAERGFWKDFDHPYYLVTLLPLESNRGMSIGGTGLTNSFATFVSNNVPINRLGFLIAHEYFHNWNFLSFGGLEDPEQLLYWFSEGVTDYYTYKLLLRSGLFSLRQYIDKYNEFTKSYYLSSARNVSNQRVLKDFFSDMDVHDIPYRRGFLLATKWNHIIQKQNRGAKSLDNVMLEIFQNAKAGKFKKLSKKLIISYLSKYAKHDFGADIEKYIERGETISGFQKELGECVNITENELGKYELDFDFTTSRQKKKIVGVKKNSAAYKEGLRDGQEVRGFSFQPGRTSVPVTLTVFENGAEKKIKYLPIGDKVGIPNYKLKPGLSQNQVNACLKKLGVG